MDVSEILDDIDDIGPDEFGDATELDLDDFEAFDGLNELLRAELENVEDSGEVVQQELGEIADPEEIVPTTRTRLWRADQARFRTTRPSSSVRTNPDRAGLWGSRNWTRSCRRNSRSSRAWRRYWRRNTRAETTQPSTSDGHRFVGQLSPGSTRLWSSRARTANETQ